MVQDYIQANTNGRLHDAREPSIAPLNRGFLYGDAVYEVWRTYHGVLFAWEEHWERLGRSAAALSLELPWPREEILAQIRRTAVEFAEHAEAAGELYVRLQIARGNGPIGLDTALAERAEYVLLVQGNRELPPDRLERGIRLSLARNLRRNDPRTLDPAWKTGNYLNNLLCLREAKGRGADEVVITNLAGEIAECAVSNIGFVRDGAVLTPGLSSGLLGGVTRRLLVEHVAPAAGVPVRETALRPADLAGMQECFLTSTTKDLVPVAEIDAHRFLTGADTVTRRLKSAFAEYTRAYAQAHPELRLQPQADPGWPA